MKSRYGNKRVTIDGFKFDSVKESRRYTDLKLLMRAKQIHDLSVHRNYDLNINGMHICLYEPDFEYVDVHTGKRVIEDVKPTYKDEAARKRYQATPAYRVFALKKKLMLAIYGVDVVEV